MIKVIPPSFDPDDRFFWAGVAERKFLLNRCANCHTLGGPAGGAIKYDDPAALTLTNMKAIPGLLDLTTPALSLFLTKPLYEPAPYNHPNATFIDINDPDYKLFLLWITQGALL